MPPSPSLSLLDLVSIGPGESIRDALDGSVRMAQRAEQLGYRRVWYAEHHNIQSIASSATAVLIANAAAHTDHIRVGAGGIMLPNHTPLMIAEQFGTLETLHPGRIDLALGRAPGSDQQTMRALRRNLMSAEGFVDDVLELQAYLSDDTRVAHVNAIPGRGTKVPLYILGSSLFGAQFAAAVGLPFAFASHFAPQSLHDAVALYREGFKPSVQLDHPYVIAGVNVIAADSEVAARVQLHKSRRARARNLFSRDGERLTDAEADQILASPQAAYIDQMLTYAAIGTPDVVKKYLDDFAASCTADELMVLHHGEDAATRVRSLELLAEVSGLPSQ